jgi:hypothetical protein
VICGKYTTIDLVAVSLAELSVTVIVYSCEVPCFGNTRYGPCTLFVVVDTVSCLLTVIVTFTKSFPDRPG